jgi:ATP-dependent protease ClpP protease subunit
MGVRITNASGDKPTIWMYGTIGDEFAGIVANDVRNALNEIPKSQRFEIRIFSDGGSFDEAMAMHSLITQRGDKSHGIVDGLAASAASLLLQATGRRSMAKHSRQMIHEVHGSIRGSFRSAEFREIADQMDATNQELISIYAKNWRGSDEDLRAALSKDTWLNAEQSVQLGLADEVIEGAKIAARVNTDLFNYKNVPDDVILAPGPFVPPWVDERMKKLEAVLAG